MELMYNFDVANLDEAINDFESLVKMAVDAKYGDNLPKVKASILGTSIIIRFDIKKFYELYKAQNHYPQERISKLIHMLFDIKLQLFFINEVDLGLYNQLVFNYESTERQHPLIQLRKLSLDQNLIVKSRILWV